MPLTGGGSARGSAFVEREGELAALGQALDGAFAGTGHAALVEGKAGLGKSTLLAEAAARARARGMQVLRARALKPEREFSFAVALQLLEGPVRSADAVEQGELLAGAASLASELLSGSGIDEHPNLARSPFSIVHGLHWVVVNLTRRGPIALCVDDLHWGDEASLRFLAYLTARLEELPIAVIAACRPRDASGEGETLSALRGAFGDGLIELRPLTRSGVRTVVRRTLPHAEDGFCATCAEASGGNPFRLGELLLAIEHEGIAPAADSADVVEALGETLLGRASVLRLSRLGPEAIALARAVAVLGNGASLRHAAALAELELERAAVAVDALMAEEILERGQSLAFVHPLTREEIYAEAPLSQRGVAHLRAGRLLAEEHAAPELVAAQLLSAPPSGAAWVLDALVEAAGRSSSQGAPESAAHYLRRALEEPPPAERRLEVLTQLGEAEAAAGEASVVAHLGEALALATDLGDRATLARLLGRALGGSGRSAEAANVFERALEELPGDHGDLRCAVLADYLTSAVFAPGLRQRAIARAEPLLRVLPAGSTAAQRSLLAAAAMRSGQRREPVASTIELARRAWSDGALLDDDGPDGAGWLMVVWALELAEDHEQAKAVSAAAIETAQRAGSLHAFANASSFHGHACYREGDLREAEADAEQAIETARSGWRRYLAVAVALKANVLIERGELAAATELLASGNGARDDLASGNDVRNAGDGTTNARDGTRNARDGTRNAGNGARDDGRGDMMQMAWRLHARGRLELASGRPLEALEQFEAAGRWLVDRLSAEHTVLPWRADAALAALALEDRDRARELIEPVHAHTRQAGLEVARGRQLRLLGLIEGGERGIELLRDAAQILAGTQAALEHAHALADLGSALRRARRRGEARVPLREALDLAHRLGATMLAQRARDQLVAVGARPRRPLITGFDALTPSEQRVAELAAQGLTNPQIAQALFVTPKTVEFHLRHVYQKLMIDGRAQLPAALGERERQSGCAGERVEGRCRNRRKDPPRGPPRRPPRRPPRGLAALRRR